MNPKQRRRDQWRRLQRLVLRPINTVLVFFSVWGRYWMDGHRSDRREAAEAAKATWRDKGPEGQPCDKCNEPDTVIRMDGDVVCLACGDRPQNYK